MKELLRLLILINLAIILTSCSTEKYKGEYIENSIIWKGLEREYLIYLPSRYNTKELFPLLIGLHGYTGTASGFEKETTKGMNHHAEKHQFIAVYPQGSYFWGKKGNYPFFVSSWNDIESNAEPREGERQICSNKREEYPKPEECKKYSHCAWTSCHDDVGFIKEVLNQVTKEYKVDKSRRYLVGMSNGGAMAHRFGCLHPELLAAVVSVSGSIPRDRSCTPNQPLPYMQVFGDKDETTPINGELSIDGWYYEKPDISFEKWANALGCKKEMKDANLSIAKERGLICLARRNCSEISSHEVVNCLIPGGKHAWPGQTEGKGYCITTEQKTSIPRYSQCQESDLEELNWGNEIIWQFLSKHRKDNE